MSLPSKKATERMVNLEPYAHLSVIHDPHVTPSPKAMNFDDYSGTSNQDTSWLLSMTADSEAIGPAGSLEISAPLADDTSYIEDGLIRGSPSQNSYIPTAPIYQDESASPNYDRLSQLHSPASFGTSRSSTAIVEREGRDLHRHLGHNLDGSLTGPTWETQISQLNLELCAQLRRSVDLSSMGPLEFVQVEGERPKPSRFNDAVSSMHAFSDILQEIMCPRSDPEGTFPLIGPFRRQSPGVCHPSLGLPCALDILSCYLRLVRLVQRMIVHLSRLLRSSPLVFDLAAAGISHEMFTAGYDIADQAGRQGMLQIKNLLQAVEQRFAIIESLLALPIELRVSDTREAHPTGILNAEWVRELVFWQRDSSHAASDALYSGQNGSLSVVRSLRDHIIRLRQWLDLSLQPPAMFDNLYGNV